MTWACRPFCDTKGVDGVRKSGHDVSTAAETALGLERDDG
jgi:hypothetical protein